MRIKKKGVTDMKIRGFYRNNSAVSPVIATILMVAITVVLSAVLYMMVAGMMTSATMPQTPLAATADHVSNGAVLTIAQGSDQAAINGTIIVVLDYNKAPVSITNASMTDAIGEDIATYNPGTGELSYTGTDNGRYQTGMKLAIQGDFEVGYSIQLKGDGFSITETRIN